MILCLIILELKRFLEKQHLINTVCKCDSKRIIRNNFCNVVKISLTYIYSNKVVRVSVLQGSIIKGSVQVSMKKKTYKVELGVRSKLDDDKDAIIWLHC